jgi:hypothetical protein
VRGGALGSWCGGDVTPVLEEELSRLTAALERSLAKTTIAAVAKKVAARTTGAAIARVLGR